MISMTFTNYDTNTSLFIHVSSSINIFNNQCMTVRGTLRNLQQEGIHTCMSLTSAEMFWRHWQRKSYSYFVDRIVCSSRSKISILHY